MILEDFASNPELGVGDPAELRSQDQEGTGFGGVRDANVFFRKEFQILGNEDSGRQLRVLGDHPVRALHCFQDNYSIASAALRSAKKIAFLMTCNVK